jgi:hypothetical protein
MRIVSENSEADLARRRAMAPVDWALRDLTANLMRITRGAGRPYEIGRQAQALVDALIEFRDATGVYPSPDEISDTLAIGRGPEDLEKISDDHLDEIFAERAIIRGCLRIVASRLLDQRLQVSAGESEMYGGIKRLEDIRAAQRKKWATAARTAAKADVGRKASHRAPPLGSPTRALRPQGPQVAAKVDRRIRRPPAGAGPSFRPGPLPPFARASPMTPRAVGGRALPHARD